MYHMDAQRTEWFPIGNLLRVAGVCGVMLSMACGAAAAQDLHPASPLYAGLNAPEARPGLSGSVTRPAVARLSLAASDEPLGPSPFAAGLLSAIIPGSGQLLQKKSRGWAYLGIEVAGWFSYAALSTAEDQARTDANQYADSHWSEARYGEITSCGDGLGPIDFEQEQQELASLYETNRDAFYSEIGRNDVYACGWDDQASRSSFLSQQDDADNLGSATTWAVTALVLNHLVSAIDAAKVASDRRKQVEPSFSWNWNVRPEANGMAMDLRIQQRF